MLDDKLKIRKNQLLDKILPRFLIKINPSLYSIAGLIFFIMTFYLILQSNYFLAIIIFSISRIFDGLDGYVAKVTNRTSIFGEFVDQTIDLVIYAFFIIAVVISRYTTTNVILGLSILSIYYVNIYINSMYFSIIKHSELTNNDKIIKPLVEGTETLGFYALFLLFDELISQLFVIFLLFLVIGATRQFLATLKLAKLGDM